MDLTMLERQLNTLSNLQSNPQSTREALTMALKLLDSRYPKDITGVITGVTKYASCQDLVCKKLASWFIVSCKGEADVLLMVVNSLMKDCSHPSPVTRCLALKTLTHIQLVEFVEYSLKAVSKGLNDNSAYVRRAAVVSCLKISSLNPDIVDDHNIIDILYAMIRDNDPIVVLNCLQVLDELLQKEGGIVINKNIAYYLLNNTKQFPEWGTPILLEFLSKYEPQSEDEIYNIMNLIDGYLEKGSATIVVMTIEFLIKLIKDMPNMAVDVLSHVKNPLLHFVNSGNPELTTMVITFVEKIYIPQYVAHLQTSYQLFLCKQKEPSFVKYKRIQILSLIVNDNNVDDILDELILYSSSSELCQISINAIGKIGTMSDSFHDLSIKKLIQMLDVGTETIKIEIFTILSTMNISKMEPGVVSSLMEQMGNSLSDSAINENEGVLTCLFWLLGECGEKHEDMPYILESFFQDFKFWENTDLCTTILIAIMKLFLKSPAEYQALLGELFEKFMKNSGVALREKVSYYYNLLKEENLIVIKSILL